MALARAIRAWAPWIVSWPNEEATGPVSGVRMPRVIVFPVVTLAFDVLEPAAPVVLDDELQAAVTPDTRMVTTAARATYSWLASSLKPSARSPNGEAYRP